MMNLTFKSIGLKSGYCAFTTANLRGTIYIPKSLFAGEPPAEIVIASDFAEPKAPKEPKIADPAIAKERADKAAATAAKAQERATKLAAQAAQAQKPVTPAPVAAKPEPKAAKPATAKKSRAA